MKKSLIIGQGIAGTLLAVELLKRGREVHLVDGNLAGSSSIAAAGIINPITGKRFVKSWRFEEFYPIAKTVYQQLEQELGIQIWEERPILRLLGSPEEANDWAIRCAQAEYIGQMSELPDAGAWSPLLKPGFSFGQIQQSGRVNMPLLLTQFRTKAIQEGFMTKQTIELQDIESLLKTYDPLIFCEGWRAENNPYFPEAAFRVSKGEALIIRFPELEIDHFPTQMLKKTMLLLPQADGTFWAGSTYRWHFEDTEPSKEGREFILGYLNEMFAAPFEVVEQVAGIRPTMVDRRPVVEQSKQNPNVYMFNGLGTKGALLAPFFAAELAEKISMS